MALFSERFVGKLHGAVGDCPLQKLVGDRWATTRPPTAQHLSPTKRPRPPTKRPGIEHSGRLCMLVKLLLFLVVAVFDDS